MYLFCCRRKLLLLISFSLQKKTLVDDSHLLEGLKVKDAELERLAEVIQHFKKLLAETEKKLSEAYGEISALRMLQSEHVIQGKVTDLSERITVCVPSEDSELHVYLYMYMLI